MILEYVGKALARARYERLEDGSYCATVPGLDGVIALGSRVEKCRTELVEAIEEWVLVRVATGLQVPRLGGVSVRVSRAP